MLMLKVGLTCFALLGIAALTIFYVARSRDPQRIAGYSVTMTVEDFDHPEKSYTQRIYVNRLGPERGVRFETTHRQRTTISLWGAGQRSTVLDPATKTFWYPRTESRVTAAITRAGDPEDPSVGAPPATRRYIGLETINGRKARRWEIIEPATNGKSIVWQYWEDVRLRTALKSLKPGHESYELTNIREGRQKADLFRIPPDYREVPSPPSQP